MDRAVEIGHAILQHGIGGRRDRAMVLLGDIDRLMPDRAFLLADEAGFAACQLAAMAVDTDGVARLAELRFDPRQARMWIRNRSLRRPLRVDHDWRDAVALSVLRCPCPLERG